jgi:hypothetical protein
MSRQVLVLLLLSLLSGCAYDCERYGVNVPAETPVTGRIVEQRIGTPEQVQAECRRPFKPARGCTMAVDVGEYIIWATDDFALQHEKCHAMYESWEHVVK